MCEDCGALVGDPAKHEQWHRLGVLDPDDPLLNVCPVCGAQPGEACRSRAGTTVDPPHVKR